MKPRIKQIEEDVILPRPKADVDNTLRDLLNSSYPTKAFSPAILPQM